jgi:predicted dehydrogenase
MKIAMLGSGFIARFYTTSLHAQRRRDTVSIVYSRTMDNAKRFAEDYNLPHFTDSMEDAINHAEVDVVIISLPNHLHEAAVAACAKAKKAVLCTKPLGRTACRGRTHVTSG